VKIKKFLWAGLIAAVLAGCASFEGTIPVESEGGDLYLSPVNNDGIMDTVRVPLSVPEAAGLKLQGYTIEIRSDQDRVVYSKSGKEEPRGFFKRKTAVEVPGEIIWNGRNQDGAWVSDGLYYLNVEVYDYKGHTGSYGPVRIIVDNTAPSAELYFPYTVFSPNNDGSQDALDVYQRNVSSESLWTGTFQDSNQSPVRTFEWKGSAANFSWDGTTDQGTPVPEGRYSYTLSSTDEAGNRFSLSVDKLFIDNTVYPVSMNITGSTEFSPNDDGVKDTVQILVDAAEKSRVRSMKMRIINAAGNPVRDLTESSTDLYIFDGKKSGRPLPEGFYYAALEVQYNNGDIQKLVSDRINLDLTPPSAVIKAAMPVFSPDNDGRKDTLEIFQSSSVESGWTGQILQEKRVVRTWSWQDRVVPVLWDGLDDAGIPASDGLYQYQLKGEDGAGNRGTFVSSIFSLDTRPTPVEITQSVNIISPNGDGDSDIVEFYPKALVRDGISGWTFSVVNAQNAQVFSVAGEGTQVPGVVSWDGRDTSGKVVEGVYRGIVEVEYLKGNFEKISSVPEVIIDLSDPVIDISTSKLPFSPDGDGESDFLDITILPSDPSGIKSWTARILDPAGTPFISLNIGDFSKGTYRWNGKDRRGELVQSASDYTLEVTAVDNVGNKSSARKIIPIDILVLKDGDRLKISISSIYFKPFTADYLSVEPAQKASNLKTLDRLAEILNKYSQYNIQLEGHAVRLLWSDPVKWKTEEEDVLLPLSRSRADTIKAALIQRGIKAERMTTNGMGGYNPVVPHSDEQNRWKNRRVEFILIK